MAVEAKGQAIPGNALYVTRLGAKVVPERVAAVSAEEAGEVEICWRGQGRVEAGTLLARVNPETLALEEEELELQIAQANLEADSEILQLTRQKEEMEFIAALPEKKRLYVAQHLEATADARALALLEQKIGMARQRALLQEKKLREAFARKAALRYIRMPFGGRVQYHLTIPPEGERALVTSGAPVLTVADDASLYVAVEVTEPALVHLETERLTVHLELGKGEDLQAAWAHKRIEKSNQTEATVYYFRVPEGRREQAWELLGSNIVVELWCRGEDDWLYEDKTALAREAGKRPFETWEELAAALRPGYAIVFSGETHLCLAPRATGKENETP